MTAPVLTLTAAQLRATSDDDEQPVEPAPRRGRPRKHPAGHRPKPNRSAPQIKVCPPSKAALARWRAAAAACGMKLSPFLAGAATAAADAALGPEEPAK